MKIQLDTKALEALFPEGSDARVDLQNAVIANFAKKIHERQVGNQIHDVVSQAIRESGQNVDAYNIARDVLNSQLSGNSWNSAGRELKANSSLATAVRQYTEKHSSLLQNGMESWAIEIIENTLGKRAEQGKQFVEQYIAMAEANIAKAKNQALSEIESRIVAACKQSMPEIIRREMANYLNKESQL